MDINFIYSLITGILVGAAAGYLGSLMVLKRMALVGDALSHVALPGLGLALLYDFNPFLGAFAFLAFAVLVIWKLERKTNLPIEALVGILFTASLAVGILITPEPELLEALFGDISKTTFVNTVIAAVLSILVIFIGDAIYGKIVLASISEDWAVAKGINISKTNLIFFMLVALIVALGVKVVGTLLMGSLVIIPAAASKNLSSNMRTYTILSLGLGIVSVVVGLFVSQIFGPPPGAVIVLASIAIFIFSLLFKK